MAASHLPGPPLGTPPPDPGIRLFLEDVARLAGVDYSTARRYHAQAEMARRNTALGLPVPGPWRTAGLLPPPDEYQHGHGRPRPYWHPATLDPWLAARRGPGRPRTGNHRPGSLTERDVIAIKKELAARRRGDPHALSQAELARRFQVHPSTIAKIAQGKLRAHPGRRPGPRPRPVPPD
jgi:hypothetical protein